MSQILWQPSQARIATSNLTHFTEKLSQTTHTSFPDYQALHEWSIEHLEAFWEFFLDYTRVIYSKRHTEVLSSHRMPGARWFTGMELNYAENLLRHDTDGVAIRAFVEADQTTGRPAHVRELSFAELRTLVARCAKALAKNGITRGDRVAGYVANVPEAVVACLACASLGAVWSSASPDFGLEALCDRFGQVQPRVVFASTHYRYGGKTFSTKKVVQELKTRLPGVERVIAIPYPVDGSEAGGDVMWEDFLAEGEDAGLKFEQVPFEHPLFILFSSGTTGAPKCMVHGTGGTLLQHRKELQLHCDLKAGDRLLFFTTCGWMMWNWQLSALSLGATIYLFDGNPGHPALSAIWQVVDQNAVTHFGTSGRFLESCMKAHPPLSRAALGSFARLRTLMYTGSPLSVDGFRWVYQNIKTDLHLAGISGGTDIVSCFVLGNPNLPVRAGEIQCRGLGVDVVALDDAGEVLE
ncbi:MAG: acetoacetate--CoA ligase, partial [Calditrichaeota bacterium]